MKSTLLLPILALALVSPMRAQDNEPKKTEPPAAGAKAAPDPQLKEKMSVFFGKDIATNLEQMQTEFGLDVALVLQSVKDALDKKPLKFSDAELTAAFQEFRTQMIARQQAEMAKQQAEMAKATAELATSGPKNAEEGAKFLAENGKRDGVTTTASGLQYEVLKKGDGAKPKATDNVTVHYRGTLLNEKEFDSSYSRNEPATFPLNQVIPGWTEGVQLMSVGSKFKFFIPSKLAYGENGSPPRIGPNSTLVFEVELLSIEN